MYKLLKNSETMRCTKVMIKTNDEQNCTFACIYHNFSNNIFVTDLVGTDLYAHTLFLL